VNSRVKTEDEKSFGTIVGQIGVHVPVDADKDGDHGKKSSDTNHHAEHGEKGTHLVLTKGSESHLSVFADVHAHSGFPCPLKFLAQGFDGLKRRSFFRRVHAEEYTHGGVKILRDDYRGKGDAHVAVVRPVMA
jgi:hypothetical protein